MELVLLLIVVLAVAWFLGFLKSGIKVADMANRKVGIMDAKQKAKATNEFAAIEIDTDTMSKAKANKAALDAFEF